MKDLFAALRERVSKLTRAQIAIIVAVVVALVAAIIIAIVLAGSGGNPVYVQKVDEVSLGTRNTGFTNRYGAVAESSKDDIVKFDTKRKLGECKVTLGTHVAKDQELFTYNIDNIDLEIELAQVEVDQANRTLQGATSDSARSTAQADVNSKQGTLDGLKKLKEDPTVRSPAAGTITNIADLETAAAGTDGTTNYITILADGNLRIKGKVSEQNVALLTAGTSVIVRSRVDTSVTWNGTISSIETAPSSDLANASAGSSLAADYASTTGTGTSTSTQSAGASNYSFYVQLDNARGILLGQHVTVELAGGTSGHDGVWLPSGWIVWDGDSTYAWACTAEGARLERRGIQLGDYDELLDAYEIKSGISATDYLAWPDNTCRAGAPTTTDYSVAERAQTGAATTAEAGVYDTDTSTQDTSVSTTGNSNLVGNVTSGLNAAVPVQE